MKHYDPKYLSDCHNSKVYVAGGVGDFHDNDKAVTMHYECDECEKPCNIHPTPDQKEP